MKFQVHSFKFLRLFSKFKIRGHCHAPPTQHRNIEEIFQKYFIEKLQYCKNIYKAVRKVSEILQGPCNVRSKHYKWNVAAIFIFHCNIAVM